MNAPVDVLAVMEAAERAAFYASEQQAREMREARAAVAEMIEAARVVAECPPQGESAKREGAMARLTTAIARVGDAK